MCEAEYIYELLAINKIVTRFGDVVTFEGTLILLCCISLFDNFAKTCLFHLFHSVIPNVLLYQ